MSWEYKTSHRGKANLVEWLVKLGSEGWEVVTYHYDSEGHVSSVKLRRML